MSAPDNARPRRRAHTGMRTVHETSAGGLVVDGLGGPPRHCRVVLIGRTDRRGRLAWSLPKGHIETGETAEQTAVREVAEETGVHGDVVAELGTVSYWFVADGRRIHKTVHHFLIRYLDGDLTTSDYEVDEIAWVPLHELRSWLAHPGERRLARVAEQLIGELGSDRRRQAPTGDDGRG
ncbi:NUDIX hydrolase [Nocardia nova]|uniref:NUDIX hydrolase n=1 Tax=Nocardia nova TaxID=37330 RepID=UPI0033DE5AF2